MLIWAGFLILVAIDILHVVQIANECYWCGLDIILAGLDSSAQGMLMLDLK